MKKLLSFMLTLVLVLSMGTVAFAADSQEASFKKTYKITNNGTSNPEETFTFTFTADHVTDSNKNLSKDDMPQIDASTVKYEAGKATVSGLDQSVDVALSKVQWPGVGVYYYQVKETAGTTAGVTYDSSTAWLKVTVAYDDGTNTYYTAFVTLNLADNKGATDDDGNEIGNGITDQKIAGFTNEYSAGSLAISKKVTGNMGDKNAYFAVKVTLTGEEGKNYLASYNVTGGSYASNPSTIAIGTETTFYLKDEETITISNLPYGVTYTVVEEDYTPEAKGGYDQASYNYDADEDENAENEQKIDDACDKVEITNNKGTVVDTGIVLDSMPYVLMLAAVCMGLALFFSKKRMMREN